MIDMLLAAALAQAAPPAPEPCNALAAPPAAANCPRWRSVARSDRFEIFVDPGSVRQDGGGVELVTRLIYAQAQEVGMRSGLARYWIDCAQRTATMRYSRYFNGAGVLLAEGEPDGDGAGAKPVAEGGALGQLLTEFCPH